MDAIIQRINIYKDNVIEIDVICNQCKKNNTHTITHASHIINKNNNSSDRTVIDFSKLGKRCCDNKSCTSDYKLYNTS